jgi:hypothetical protein
MSSMTSERAIRKRLAEVSGEAAGLRAALEDKKRKKLIVCSACGKRTCVSALTYIQTHFYIAPYSCTGGDYWKQGEGAFVCPKCGARNRLYNRPEVVALKPFFATIEKEHKR